jgi:hypothetical protein
MTELVLSFPVSLYFLCHVSTMELSVIIIWKTTGVYLPQYLSGREKAFIPIFFSLLLYFIHCIWHGLAFFPTCLSSKFFPSCLLCFALASWRYFHYVSINTWCMRSDDQCFSFVPNFGVLGCYKNLYMFEYVIHLLINMTEILDPIYEHSIAK